MAGLQKRTSTMTDWYAHAGGADHEHWEPLGLHLERVARLAGPYADTIGAPGWGRPLGLLHDIGKSCDAFQHRLAGGPSIDHATAGGREAVARWGNLGRLMAYALVGHHGGLPDFTDLERRLKNIVPAYDTKTVGELAPPPLPPVLASVGAAEKQFPLSFFVRMLYSCLVDADFLATECYFDPGAALRRGPDSSPDMGALEDSLDGYLAGMEPNETPINSLRAKVLERCRAMADAAPGLFSLTVPTGGGKTLSSLAFALRHARRHELDRVIYVIPYTSIIEQTAAVFRSALPPGTVLEHHSNYRHPKDNGTADEFDDRTRLRLAEETWDMPVVVTTTIQFFESLFTNRASRCRKLHNIARSVVVLDEVQLLPADFLRPCLAVVGELVRGYGATVVLCTATQPALRRSADFRAGLTDVREIMTDPHSLHDQLRRVAVERLGRLGDGALAEAMRGHPQVLTVVDRRRHAAELFRLLGDVPGAAHLSARMCPAHRREKLAAIRQDLKDGRPCRLVSTQLIEAGVDVDFPVVYRAMAGLDSIIQAAGRCNREGRRALGAVRLFEPDGWPLRGEWHRRAEITRLLLDQVTDPLAPATIERFFRSLYADADLDHRKVLGTLLPDPRLANFNFKTAANLFRLIDTEMIDVIVPWDDEAHWVITAVRASDTPQAFLRDLQPYTVQLYANEVAALITAGAIETVRERFRVLDREAYHDALGVMSASDAVRPDGMFV
ncbi:MAG: CRISPR-associated helicase Cas3' [Alphaproteobacteria bacterium]